MFSSNVYLSFNMVFFVYRFHHQRVPLVILVCGTACVGKSTIATQLAQRLNLPNVLQVSTSYCKVMLRARLWQSSPTTLAPCFFLFQFFSVLPSHLGILVINLLLLYCLNVQTDMVYELLRTATEYAPSWPIVSFFFLEIGIKNPISDIFSELVSNLLGLRLMVTDAKKQVDKAGNSSYVIFLRVLVCFSICR